MVPLSTGHFTAAPSLLRVKHVLPSDLLYPRSEIRTERTANGDSAAGRGQSLRCCKTPSQSHLFPSDSHDSRSADQRPSAGILMESGRRRGCGRRGEEGEEREQARSEVRDDGRFIKCLHPVREEIKCKYSGGNQNYKSIFEQRELLTFFPHIISSLLLLLLDPQFNSWQDNFILLPLLLLQLCKREEANFKSTS